MRKFAIFGGVVALSTAAVAQDTLDFNGTGCTLTLVEDAAHEAEIVCHNALTFGSANDEGALRFKGGAVGLTIHHGPGMLPDTFTFFAPDGYVVIPDILILDEDTSGAARVYPFVGM
jgi:hypothetical protein